jgi:predicted SprT family Zn-dependent metalloprotease
MDGNQNDSHVFQPQDISNLVHTPLGFNYDNNIDGSIATLAESCNIFNIHKLKHDNVPATHNAGSEQIDFIYISQAADVFSFHCGILDFRSLFYSEHRPLLLDIDILLLLGYPLQGTVKFIERDLKLNDPRLVEVYQSSLFQQLVNHSFAARVDALYLVNASDWLIYHDNKFNQIDREIERAMKYAANACRRKSYKNHKWMEECTCGIYSIQYWRLRLNMLDNNNNLNDSTLTLQFYADKSGLLILYNTPT